jgi:hypothetical protein
MVFAANAGHQPHAVMIETVTATTAELAMLGYFRQDYLL